MVSPAQFLAARQNQKHKPPLAAYKVSPPPALCKELADNFEVNPDADVKNNGDILRKAQDWHQKIRRNLDNPKAYDLANLDALKLVRPFIEPCLMDNTIRPNLKLWTYTAMWSVNINDYDFAVKMLEFALANDFCKLDVELIKRDIDGFVLDGMCKYLRSDEFFNIVGKGVGTRRSLKKTLPDYFHVIFAKVYKKQWKTFPAITRMLYSIAAYHALFHQDKRLAILYLETSAALLERGSDLSLLKELKAELSA